MAYHTDSYDNYDEYCNIKYSSVEQIEYISTEQINRLLSIVGPEGLYDISEKLINAANKDMINGLNF